MGLIASITKLDRRFGWSFLGFVLAALFGLLSLYTEFWKETAPHLEFELLSNTPVLDVRERLPDLEVLYRGQDITKSGKTLSVLLVRLVNHGSADLLSAHYDSKAPVGLKVTGGALIRAELSAASNEYLKEVASLTAKNSSAIFEPVILEPGEWLLAKLLVLHSVGSQPTVSAHGKVAGMHSIPVVPPLSATEKEGFWYGAFSGSIWTQLVRLIAYFLGSIFLVAGIIIPSALISESITSRRRARLVRRFKAVTKLPISSADEFVFEGFIRSGLRYVQRLTNAVADPERLQKRVSSYPETKDQPRPSRDAIEEAVIMEMSGSGRHVHYPGGFTDVASMIEHGFIVKSEGRWGAVPERLRVATSFIEYIELVGATNV